LCTVALDPSIGLAEAARSAGKVIDHFDELVDQDPANDPER
jgi:hypothetical protein